MSRKRLSPAEWVGLLAQKSETTIEQTKAVLRAQAEAAYEHAAEGYLIPGVGVLAMVERPERKLVMMFGPRAAQEITMPATRKLVFRLSKVARDMVLGGTKTLPDLFRHYALPDFTFSSEATELSEPDAFTRDLRSSLTSVGGKPCTVAVHRLTDFWLSSGKIVAGDLMIGGGKPFVRSIPAGRYPIALAVARIGSDERIAFAILRFSEAPISKWERAETEDRDIPTRRSNPRFGYGVDSGTGSFYDASAQDFLNQANEADIGFFEQVADEMKKTYKTTRSWVHIDSPSGSIVVFSSGYGDGFYTSYFGLDASGNAAILVTDFGIVDWAQGESGIGPVGGARR